MASARSTYKVAKSADSPVEESLRDVFRCFICMEKLQEAHLCPHCSKLCCYTCISKWLTEQRRQCPHCRAKLHVNELVNCRWFEEVAVQVESLQQICANINPNAMPMDQDLCRTHEEKLTVYCLTCRCCICHQCALWGGTHSGHTFKKLELVYESHVAMVKEELTNSQKRLTELTTYIEDAEYNVMIVREAKEDRVKEIRNAVDAIIARLDSQLKTKLTMVMRQKRIISKDKEELERVVQEIDLQVNSGSRSQLINKSPEMLKSLMAGQEKSTYDFVPQHVPPDFVSEIVPQYDSCDFSIEKFTQLQKDGLVVYSKSLLINGMCWRLKVYPCGNGPARGRYLSAFLELSNGHPGSSKYEYRIQMLHESINKEVSREFVSDFETGECWGYNRFFPLDMLASEGYLNVENDTLELRFQVRPPTYFQRSRDQQFYIHQLLKMHRTQADQITNLKEQLDRERKQNELLQSKPPQIDTQSLALVTGQTTDAQHQVESSRLSLPPLSSRTVERRSLIKSDKAEANEKIFSEILKCLSPNIGHLNVGQRPSTAPASTQSGSTSSSAASSTDKIGLSPLGNSSNSMLTESSDEDGAMGSSSPTGINVAILNGLTAAAASVGGGGSTMGRKMNSLDVLSVASSESESDENLNGGRSGSSSTDDREDEDEECQAIGENLVEYAEVPVPAANSNVDRSKNRGGAAGASTQGGDSSSAALEESVILLSLLDMPAPISFRPGGRCSQPRQMQPVQSASVLETLLEPPRISSGPLVSQLSRFSSSGSSSSSSDSSSLRYRNLSARSIGHATEFRGRQSMWMKRKDGD